VLLTSLFVIHDTSRGGQDKVTELTGRQQVSGPLFELGELDVETGRDDTTLVDTTVELNNNLTGTVIINDFELANVTWKMIKISVKCIQHLSIITNQVEKKVLKCLKKQTQGKSKSSADLKIIHCEKPNI